MKYLILNAKDLQCGDVIFSTDKKLCARVLGESYAKPTRGVTEYRLDIIVGDEQGHTTIRFDHGETFGVAREDDFVTVDVAALLTELDGH